MPVDTSISSFHHWISNGKELRSICIQTIVCIVFWNNLWWNHYYSKCKVFKVHWFNFVWNNFNQKHIRILSISNITVFFFSFLCNNCFFLTLSMIETRCFFFFKLWVPTLLQKRWLLDFSRWSKPFHAQFYLFLNFLILHWHFIKHIHLSPFLQKWPRAQTK